MNRKLSACLSVLLISQAVTLSGKPTGNLVRKDQQRVERIASRPDLALHFDRGVQIKVAGRKSTFHLGEMIMLDIAMLNATDHPLFFRKISDLQIRVQDSVGGPVGVQLYGVADRAIVPSSFTRVPPNEFLHHSFQLLAQCDNRAFDQLQAADKDSLAIFNNNLFLNWGDACLRITQPGTYFLTAEVKNDYVLVAPRLEKTMTASGKIESKPLEITILN